MFDAPLTVEELGEIAIFIRLHPNIRIIRLGDKQEVQIIDNEEFIKTLCPREFLNFIRQETKDALH